MVLYHNDEDTMALSFKLEFPCLNNTTEYEAYLTRLATALEMRIKHLKVTRDSNLVVFQAKGCFSLKKPRLPRCERPRKLGCFQKRDLGALNDTSLFG